MKAETIYITTAEQQRKAVGRILELEVGSKYQVTIANAGSKTSRQRGYQWRLYTDISKSGLGGIDEETPNSVNIRCKREYAVPIFKRDDDFFRELFNAYERKFSHDPVRMNWFFENMVHTEDFNTSQMAEYITMIINYYAPKGVPLTDPSEYNLKTKKSLLTMRVAGNE